MGAGCHPRARRAPRSHFGADARPDWPTAAALGLPGLLLLPRGLAAGRVCGKPKLLHKGTVPAAAAGGCCRAPAAAHTLFDRRPADQRRGVPGAGRDWRPAAGAGAAWSAAAAAAAWTPGAAGGRRGPVPPRRGLRAPGRRAVLTSWLLLRRCSIVGAGPRAQPAGEAWAAAAGARALVGRAAAPRQIDIMSRASCRSRASLSVALSRALRAISILSTMLSTSAMI